MAKFKLTAHQTMNLGQGIQIPKGQQLSINIPIMGITPGNLFGNPRCKDALLQQLSVNGINVPPNSPILDRGHWEVKMLPF